MSGCNSEKRIWDEDFVRTLVSKIIIFHIQKYNFYKKSRYMVKENY